MTQDSVISESLKICQILYVESMLITINYLKKISGINQAEDRVT